MFLQTREMMAEPYCDDLPAVSLRHSRCRRAHCPLFARVPNQTQHDAKAVSTSYARKLASDSATALQIPDS
jgi:hypothetical protein